nr:DUF4407 domain-containing protein [Reyranella sp.]
MTPPDGLGPNDTTSSSRESHAEPTWDPGPELGLLGHALITLSGVDYKLARKQPRNEQRTMALVGAALIFGAAFQAVCIFIALHVMLGDGPWQLTISIVVTTIATGILLVYDCKFVAHLWNSQGLAFCQSRGIVQAASPMDRAVRPLGILVRWAVSLAVASFVAWFVLLEVFDADVRRELARENRAANAPVFALVEARYAALLADADQQIVRHDATITGLTHEHTDLLSRGLVGPAVDRQIAVLEDQVAKLRAAFAEADGVSSIHQTAANAEEHGVRAQPSSTGVRGTGPVWAFHDREAQKYRAKAGSIRSELEPAAIALKEAQDRAVGAAAANKAEARDRVANIEQRLASEQRARATAATELREMENGREAWIQSHVQQASSHIPMPTGLSDRLRALWTLVLSSELIGTVAIGLKLFIMALESAGPVSKTLFGAAGIYGMRAAMRIEEVADAEAERREVNSYAAFLRRSRREEQVDAALRAQRQRDMGRRGFEELSESIERASAGGRMNGSATDRPEAGLSEDPTFTS